MYIKVVGQKPTTFVKKLDLLNSKSENSKSENSKSHYIFKNELYINSAALCPDKSCSVLSKLDQFGDIIWNQYFPWLRFGNDNTINIKDTVLYLATHGNFDTKPMFQVMKLNVNTGDSLAYFQRVYEKNEITDNGLEGCLLVGDSLLLYGWAERDVDDTISGIMQWINLNGEFGKFSQYVIPNNKNNGMFELVRGDANNLHFIFYNRQIKNNKFNDSRRITTIDNNGTINSIFDYGHNNAGIFVPVGMTITDSNDFIFTAWQPDSIFGGSDAVQIVRTDFSGNVKWVYNWPSLFAGDKLWYTISDVQIAKNGDIIGCGYIFKGWYDAYIFRMSSDGIMIWERRYNYLDSLDEKFDAIYLNNVGEDSDGNIIASGSHTNSSNFDDKVILIKTDADGCIDSLGCEYRTIIEDKTVSTAEVVNSINDKIFPNPTSDKINFSIPEHSSDLLISLYDMQGRLKLRKKTDNENEIDVSHLITGTYILNVVSNDRSYNTKFIKY